MIATIRILPRAAAAVMRCKRSLGVAACGAALFLSASAAQAASFGAAFELTTIPGGFFDPASGYVNGSTSHTNTVCLDNGEVEICFDVTVEGFDAAGAPAPLHAFEFGSGVATGSHDRYLDEGDVYKVTYNAITVNSMVTNMAVASAYVDLSSIRIAAWHDGDQFTYVGVGDMNMVGDDTQHLSFPDDPELSPGSMFTVQADAGSFTMHTLSQGLNYELRPVPEPTSLALGLLGLLAWRRKR
ncbi:MAG: PEP-CTERM sorting domain-containing protein [Planctomycetales bacterium]|nr:PEP-CTERM sorting domain-containing protein [Planctomycetales bacterium]